MNNTSGNISTLQRISITLAALSAAAALSASSPVVTHDFRTSAPRAGALRLVIDVPEGELNIENGADDVIEASGTVRREYSRAGQIPAAQRIADDSSVEIHIDGTRAIVRRAFGPNARSRGARSGDSQFIVNLRIPRGMHLEVRQSVGAVKIAGLFGDLLVGTRVGDISITVPKKSIKELTASSRVGDVTTNLGDRVISKEGLFAGSTHFFNEGGTSILEAHVTVGHIDIVLTE